MSLSALESIDPFYYSAIVGGFGLLVVSLMLQAYGKRSEYVMVGVVGTDRIFTWDAIAEMVVWAGSLATANAFVPNLTTGTIILFLCFLIVGCLILATLMKNVLNTARENLTTAGFQQYVLRQAQVLMGPVVFMFAMATYASMGMHYHDLPGEFVSFGGSVFPYDQVEHLSCANETAVLSIIDIACGSLDRPFCGYESWQVACRAIQLSEATFAVGLCCSTFFVHIGLMAGIIWLYRGGQRLSEKRKRRPHNKVIPESPSPVDRTDSVFKPYVLVALVLLIFVNGLQVYQVCRFLILVPFLVQPHPIVPGSETIELPGSCYGDCQRALFIYSWVGVWALIFIVLNVEQLRSFFSERRQRAQERAREQADLKAAQATKEHEKTAESCSYFFVDAAFIKGFGDSLIPRFQELVLLDGVLHRTTVPFLNAFRGDYMLDDEYLIVSHRWFYTHMPDDGSQQAAICNHLRAHPSIKYVWFDYWCMPQGDDKKPAEKELFGWMLSNINILYVSMKVLILLDLSYISRFWTQYEAWLSMQTVSEEGLKPSTEASRRCEIVPISNADSGVAENLISMWSTKTPVQAYAVLAKPDITVTNMSDKEMQLPKIITFNDYVTQILSTNTVVHRIDTAYST